jgi:hypothetical protein
MGNDDERKSIVTLVSENSSTKIVADRARETAFRCLSGLAVNLLRIIGGAGKPETLLIDIDNARSAYIDYLQTAKAAGQVLPERACSGLNIDALFRSEVRYPATEEEWQRWARDDPYGDYMAEWEAIKLSLRRSVLREIAAELAGVSVQSQRHGNDIDSAIRSMSDAQEKFYKRRDNPVPAPSRRLPPSMPLMTPRANAAMATIAEQAIADLKRAKRDGEIASLAGHQVEGLRAVQVGSVEALAPVNSFTLDVLGRMGLLKRTKGGRGKGAWQLTDDGRLALERHAASGTSPGGGAS